MKTKDKAELTRDENKLPSEQGQLLAHLRMCDLENDAPNVKMIARYFNKSERQVQRIIDKLLKSNKIVSTTGDNSMKAFFKE